MTNYHINQATKQPNICKADVRQCPVGGQHFTDRNEAKQHIENILSKELGMTKTIQNKSALERKRDEIRNIESSDRFYTSSLSSSISPSYFLQYDYDYIEDEEGDSIIDPTSFEVSYVDVNSWAEEIVYYDENSKDKVAEILQAHGAEELDNYYVYGNNLNDVTITFFNSDMALKDIEKYYYSRNNAVDKDGVLEYVRSKGVDTTGLNPLEALKTQLTEENGEKRSGYVERSNHVRAEILNTHQIQIGATHYYNRVEQRPMQSFNSSKEIAGVAFYDKNRHTYHIVDGYHRLKDLRNNGAHKAHYFVISE